ncbi:MAG: peptidoglycan-associated lipoprotein Pal, partial [Alphaproteobacteria bacterium]
LVAACSSDDAVNESAASSTGGSETYGSGYQYPNDGVQTDSLSTGGGDTGGDMSQAGLAAAAGDRVLFGLDSHSLSRAAQATLQKQAQWLARFSSVSVVVEGHADERGTREYNLALGDRRANSVREYLVSLGVAPNRVSTVSYGKERPVAACSAESCWSQNRRGVTSIR